MSSAEPTAFHKLLAAIDTDGRLLRCYTQNIDGLEERAGLRTGIPPQRKRPSRKGKERAEDTASADTSAYESMVNTPSESGCSALGEVASNVNPPEHPPAPRCIPLHGLLRDMHCSLCSTAVPISRYLPLAPNAIACPTCDLASSIRSALSERTRRVGTLRASVVLYGEEHPEGEMIGSVVERDLKGTGRRGEREGRADLLIVAGTSLAIPGVKRIVKEMAKALAMRPDASVRDAKAPPIRTIFLNDEPPAKAGEWDGVFDVWLQGDVQEFSRLVGDSSFPPADSRRNSRTSTPRKKTEVPPTPESLIKSTSRKNTSQETTPTKSRSKSRKPPPTPDATPTKRTAKARKAVDSDYDTTPTKKRVKREPPTPRPTPPRPDVSSEARSPGVSPCPLPPIQSQPYVDLPPLTRPKAEWLKPLFPSPLSTWERSTFDQLVSRGDSYVDTVFSPARTARARFSPPPPVI